MDSTQTGPDLQALDAAAYLERAQAQAASAAQWPASERPWRRAAVLGAGTMGRGIAMCLANGGLDVSLVESLPAARGQAADSLDQAYAALLRRGRMTGDQAGAARARIALADSLPEAAGCDLVIEAVFEDLPLKQQLLRDLEPQLAPGCLVATNTSFLDIDQIAQALARPGRLVGLHFFSPAHLMPLVEVVKARASTPESMGQAMALIRSLGKQAVAMLACPGFVGNRMLSPRTQQAERLLLAGALPQDVDAVLTAFGFPMGAFAMTDMAGVDVNWRTRKARGMPLAIADAIYEAGRHGQKTGKGYYRYEAGSRQPLPDPQVQAIIEAASAAAGVSRRTISPQEMHEQLIYPMINEGMRILEEGIVARASDIDVVWRHGYGWPAASVGPMRYADQTGLARISERLAHMAQASGDASLAPAPLLQQLVREGASVLRRYG